MISQPSKRNKILQRHHLIHELAVGVRQLDSVAGSSGPVVQSWVSLTLG